MYVHMYVLVLPTVYIHRDVNLKPECPPYPPPPPVLVVPHSNSVGVASLSQSPAMAIGPTRGYLIGGGCGSYIP